MVILRMSVWSGILARSKITLRTICSFRNRKRKIAVNLILSCRLFGHEFIIFDWITRINFCGSIVVNWKTSLNFKILYQAIRSSNFVYRLSSNFEFITCLIFCVDFGIIQHKFRMNRHNLGEIAIIWNKSP